MGHAALGGGTTRLTDGSNRSRNSAAQHGFYAEAFGTPWLFGNGPWPWYNLRSSDIVRFVYGGVVKTFRCVTQRNE